jgi:hypothetical protein
VHSSWERILGWLPAWLGFVLVIAVGVVLIIVGNGERARFAAFGIAAIVSAAVACWYSARVEPHVNLRSKLWRRARQH